jgi:hypothetical protein
MRKNFIYAGVPALLALLLALPGCPNPSGSGEEPSLEGAVTVTGTLAVGQDLEADTSELKGEGTLSYQWIRGESEPIDDAAESKYTLTGSDLDQDIKVRVSRAGYRGTVESDPVGPVLAAGSKKKTITVIVQNEGIKFFSLSTGREIADGGNKDWDIAFKETRTIWTNSGDTAAHYGSGGGGGVWHTNKTDFNSVSREDAVEDDPRLSAYHTDATRWVQAMEDPEEKRLNVMSYAGYPNQDEVDGLTRETCFLPVYYYYPSAFYTMPSMGAFEATGQVYIIRHADGEHYSKVQIQTFVRAIPKDTHRVIIENF